MMKNFSSENREFWTELANGCLRCDVCPRQCQLRDQQVGYCSARKRQENKIVLISYGLTSGLSIDPVEKKPLYHFLPGIKVLSFGGWGCNLACQFCQNSSLVHSQSFEVGAVALTPEQIAMSAQEQDCAGVAFTYNEPIIAAEYVIDCAKACHQCGVKTIAVSNGYVLEEARRQFFGEIDAVNIDLKSFTEDFYQRICSGHLQPVLDTLRYLVNETPVWVEITNLIIPGKNDNVSEINELTRWIVQELGTQVPLHFSAFHPSFRMKNNPACGLVILERAREIAMENGIKFVYLGNVRHPNGSNTFCPSCNQLLIDRSGFSVSNHLVLSDGSCSYCGCAIPGVWH